MTFDELQIGIDIVTLGDLEDGNIFRFKARGVEDIYRRLNTDGSRIYLYNVSRNCTGGYDVASAPVIPIKKGNLMLGPQIELAQVKNKEKFVFMDNKKKVYELCCHYTNWTLATKPTTHIILVIPPENEKDYNISKFALSTDKVHIVKPSLTLGDLKPGEKFTFKSDNNITEIYTVLEVNYGYATTSSISLNDSAGRRVPILSNNKLFLSYARNEVELVDDNYTPF